MKPLASAFAPTQTRPVMPRLACFILLLGTFCLTASIAWPKPSSSSNSASPRHARHFTVETHPSGWRLLTILTSPPSRFALVPAHAPLPPDLPPDLPLLRPPLNRLVALSATQLPHLIALDHLDALIGFPALRYAYAPEARAAFNSNRLVEVGESTSLNLERLTVLRPDLVLAADASGLEASPARRLAALHLPYLPNADHLEASPLGRAEWIKVTALLLGPLAEAQANTLFNEIESSYLELSARAASAPVRPTVFANAPFGGLWHMPGGQSYAARLFQDAGAHYLWSSLPGSGASPLDFERIFAHARSADFWLNPGPHLSRPALLATDPRFTRFQAWQSHRLYSPTRRLTPDGGNDFWETGSLRPDLVLADLIKIFHPTLAPDHQFVFYRRLE